MRSLAWDQMQKCGAEPWPFDDRGLPLAPDPEVKVTRELVFLTLADQKEINVMTQISSATIKVKVNGNYRVVTDKPYIGGQVLDAPDDEHTRLWIKAGWVTPVPAAKKEKA
ncbi:hypothetical protein [Mycobacterium paraintracellulare]|uniref:hypothetical protein n=1 Tax=Mycobacterium paraintracellulare TaxID=1138383 RepID=UPI001915FAAC|nr:hypothetical protein [Mycobacterium paraintracellulare]